MAKAKVKEIVDSLSEMTMVEVSELIKAIEDKFDVVAMAAAPVAGIAAAGAPAGGEAAEEKSEFDVVLKSFGDNKIQVIKEVRTITELGLKEAKELVESMSKPIKEKVSKEESEEIKKKLEAAGAQVEVK